jgi:branched-chain amino acid transport system ATP-binding protein
MNVEQSPDGSSPESSSSAQPAPRSGVPRSGDAAAAAQVVPKPAPPAIEVRGLTVRFGGILALEDISVTIGPGEVAAVIGPNGSGKTTLLNAICRLNRGDQSAGEVWIHGRPMGLRGDRSEVARVGVGRSFQDPHLVGSMSVLDNVLCGAHRTAGYGLAAQVFTPWRARRFERELRDGARSMLGLLGVAHLADRHAAELPYGIRKRVDLARALIARPRVLLLDEPASGLDAKERDSLGKLVVELSSAHGMTIVMVEHDMALVHALATTAVGMHVGRVLITGSPDFVLSSTSYQEALIGSEHASSRRTPGETHAQPDGG